MIKKGKRSRISAENETAIISYALTNPLPRAKLAELIQKEVNWDGPAPEIEVLERKISKYRNTPMDKPEDKLWSITTLEKYPLPPETLPAVLKVWLHQKEINLVPFTIRQAKWVARLSFVVKDIENLMLETIGLAMQEVILDMKKRPLGMLVQPKEDLKLYALLTGEAINDERKKKILATEDSKETIRESMKMLIDAQDELEHSGSYIHVFKDGRTFRSIVSGKTDQENKQKMLKENGYELISTEEGESTITYTWGKDGDEKIYKFVVSKNDKSADAEFEEKLAEKGLHVGGEYDLNKPIADQWRDCKRR